MSSQRKAQVSSLVRQFSKKDLFIHLISALKSESFLYAGILKDEILSRPFSEKEKQTIRKSSFYPQLNGILDN
ncbi:hypothetical protein OKW21_003684 [Catalinimonas alkaloidigena]|uniref:hypothetical protein n=1 Tax=Catalinimonas alkaloidigena TaxID=1075417 RepID=UPI0024061117|nr:hypothetical protein [Catalinimonas alkaloidigena]MDF9798421.1 hypothetical protein [Catalinimonas alkaloidigena]